MPPEERNFSAKGRIGIFEINKESNHEKTVAETEAPNV
jgi:hypothetical protein